MEKPPPYDRLVLHYSEIGTKGGNRKLFETQLSRNIAGAVGKGAIGGIRRESGRLSASLRPGADVEEVLFRLARVPGLSWFAPAASLPANIDAIRETVVAMARPHPATSTFRLQTKRSYKPFPLESMEVSRDVGAAVVEESGRKVSLREPEYTYVVQIDKDRAYVHWDRRPGCGGLPVGTQGMLVAMLSGGIDSPVAAQNLMLRGCRVHLVHFLNRSISTNRVVKKIKALAEQLAYYHGPLNLTIVPFDELQREIVMVVPAELRMIVYRRMMFRIAEKIREEVRGLGFVTGDSVGQVASQTLENLRAIRHGVDWPVYSPLAGMSKNLITDQARAIGTYEISILPHEDCCSFLVAKHPETRAKLERVIESEKFDVDQGVEAALAGREVHHFDPRPVASD
jgi:tRNA uracil 4-sulfurtransferase